MFMIHYKQHDENKTIDYKTAADFVARQQLEVPDLEDFYQVTEADIDGKPIDFGDDHSVLGLYNYLVQHS